MRFSDFGIIENQENVILGECNEIKPGLQVNSEEKACNISMDYLMFSFTKNALRKYLNVSFV